MQPHSIGKVLHQKKVGTYRSASILYCSPVLRIRYVYPRSRIRLFSIPDPGSEFLHPGSRMRIKEFKYFNPKKWFLNSRKFDPGCSSQIRILTFYPSRILDPWVKKGTGSRIRNRNTAAHCTAYTIGTSWCTLNSDERPYPVSKFLAPLLIAKK
jgi:hypothetical protein